MALDSEKQFDPHALVEMPLLTATIYETLRLFPPISQLMVSNSHFENQRD